MSIDIVYILFDVITVIVARDLGHATQMKTYKQNKYWPKRVQSSGVI